MWSKVIIWKIYLFCSDNFVWSIIGGNGEALAIACSSNNELPMLCREYWVFCDIWSSQNHWEATGEGTFDSVLLHSVEKIHNDQILV